MGDHHKGDADFVLKLCQFKPHRFAQLGIERTEWFVQQEDLWLFDECAGQGNALALAAAHLIGLALGQMVQLDIGQGRHHATILVRLGDIIELEAISDVFKHGHVRENGIGLKHHVHGPLIGRDGRHVDAINEYLAFTGHFKARQHAQQRGLSTARWAEEGEEFPTRNFQGHAIHSGHLAIAFGYFFNPNNGVTITHSLALFGGCTLGAQSKDGGKHRDQDDDGRGCIDLRRHREAHHRIDFDWEGYGSGARGKEGDHKVI